MAAIKVPKGFQAAQRRAETKAQIRRLLESHDPEERHALLLDLFLEHQVAADEDEETGDEDDVKDVRPAGARKATNTEVILSAIRNSSHVDVDALAEKLYASTDTGGKAKVRGILATLTHRGKLRKLGRDNYKVVDP